MNLHKHQLFL